MSQPENRRLTEEELDDIERWGSCGDLYPHEGDQLCSLVEEVREHRTRETSSTKPAPAPDSFMAEFFRSVAKQHQEPTAAPVIEIVRAIQARTKHGTGGSGGAGPCDADCLKCRAMAWLARNDVQL